MSISPFKIVCGLALVALLIFSSPFSAVATTPASAGLEACHHREGRDLLVVTTELAGVPAILRIPTRIEKPPIVLWHGFGPPASEQALMEVLPLDDVPAIKVYLGLPLFGKRAPSGGMEDLVRRQKQDVGLKVFEPVVAVAANELPRVVRELKQQGCMKRNDKIGLFGFSAGGASALIALAERSVGVRAAVLLNPSTGLTASVEAFERATKQSYTWTPKSRALAARTDAVQRAADIAKGTPTPAVLLLEGTQDDLIAHASLTALADALTPRYEQAHERVRFLHLAIPGLSHNVTGSHSEDELGRQASVWFNRYL